MPKTATLAKRLDVLRVYTTCNAIKMSLSAKQVDSVFKAGCGVSDLKPDGTAKDEEHAFAIADLMSTRFYKKDGGNHEQKDL